MNQRADNATLCAAIIAARAAHDADATPARKRALDAAVNAACDANDGLVQRIANNYVARVRLMDRDDIVQEGRLGLHRALQTYDPARGFTLSTYASWWIKQTIRRAIDTTDLPIRIPVGLLETRRMQVPIAARCRAQHGREPTMEEFRAAARTSPQSAERAARLDTGPLASLDRQTYDDGPSLVESMSGYGETPEEAAIRAETDRGLERLLATVTARAQGILRARANERTLDDIGAELGVTRERVRQIETAALSELRANARRAEYECVDLPLRRRRVDAVTEARA
jgi:RNA polymerase primary sigma factor/RNA polymerase nonessential primary-like sigma factor